MQTAGFLQVNDPVNGCRVLVDNWMVGKLSASDPACVWQLNNECPSCGCSSLTCGVEQIEETWWYDPARPASKEFYGLYGAVSISQPAPSVTTTGTGTIAEAPLKQLTFVGAIIACTARGAAFGQDLIAGILEPFCRPCAGRDLEIGLWCPDNNCDPPGSELLIPDGPDVVDWSSIDGITGCGNAALLDPTPDPTPWYDNGLRVLPAATYNTGSFTELSDSSGSIPVCHGMRVTFSFSLGSGEGFRKHGPTCIMNAPVEEEPEPCCLPISWDLNPPEQQCGCPLPCDCETQSFGPTLERSPSPRVRVGGQECGYSTPLCSQTFACLTETVPSPGGTLSIRVTAGQTELRNASITVWEARPGLPSPSTPEGLGVYEAFDPIADAALISYVPPGGTVTIDGVSESEWLDCPRLRDQQDADVSRCGGRRFRHSRLCCGRRYWVAVEVECDSTGWSVETDVFTPERL